ncbi:hypothetical protein LSM04_000715 [Trypanosoma melophagium]|uniref:uncharacterized protein n=1 Tax=Trypanosoma melophagium TaxID=715481 RepID=UPI003519EFA7|nr:hypothetical protein LSM04_000715 [Trypanosoma melophagium]
MERPSLLPFPFIILGLAAALLLIYFVVGSIVRYHKGMRQFPEVLPNYRCWCALVGSLLVILTCGRCRLGRGFRSNSGGAYYHNNYHNNNNNNNNNNVNTNGIISGGVFPSILHGRARHARDLAFEALQSDLDEEFSDEVETAMQPAAVVKMRGV